MNDPGVNLDGVIDRFKCLLEFQKDFQLETVPAKFTEHDLKEIIYLLGELKAVKEVDE